MRIGIVTEEYQSSTSPIAEHVHQFAREARRLGHTVKVLTGTAAERSPSGRARGRGRPGERSAGGAGPLDRDVIRLGRSRVVLGGGSLRRMAGGLGVGGALRAALLRERLDVVHVHGPLTPVLPLLAVHHAASPLVGTFHEPYEPGVLGRLFPRSVQRYLDRLDAAVVTSRATLASLPERIRGDLWLVPPGVDVERLARGCRIRRYQDGKLNVLYAGPLEPRAGLDLLFAAVRRASLSVEIRLFVVGGGPLTARYRALVLPPLEGEVIFAPPSTESRPDWLATADVCCAPAAAPGAVLEGMAAGRPVLAADLEQNRELMQHGREGELLPPADAGAWARALARLGREPVRGAAYGERGRAGAQRHGWAGVAREVLSLYRSIGVRG